MKDKKAVKKINEALGSEMDTVLLLGVDKDRKTLQRLTYGDDKVLVELILNLFNKEPKFADEVLKIAALEKLNLIVAAGESDKED